MKPVMAIPTELLIKVINIQLCQPVSPAMLSVLFPTHVLLSIGMFFVDIASCCDEDSLVVIDWTVRVGAYGSAFFCYSKRIVVWMILMVGAFS